MSRSVDRGASSEGLITIVQPAASAGPSLYATSSSGKFHGVIAATTPTGSRLATVNMPGIEFGSTLPSIFVVHPA